MPPAMVARWDKSGTKLLNKLISKMISAGKMLRITADVSVRLTSTLKMKRENVAFISPE